MYKVNFHSIFYRNTGICLSLYEHQSDLEGFFNCSNIIFLVYFSKVFVSILQVLKFLCAILINCSYNLRQVSQEKFSLKISVYRGNFLKYTSGNITRILNVSKIEILSFQKIWANLTELKRCKMVVSNVHYAFSETFLELYKMTIYYLIILFLTLEVGRKCSRC